MVAQEVEETVVAGVTAAPEGNRSTWSGVVAGACPCLILVHAIDVDRGHAVDGSYNPVAVSVVDKLTDDRRPLLELGQPVLVVKIEGVRHAANSSTRLVAIGVVAI